MNKNKFPSISIVIPTLNSEAVLNKCLESISIQDYPKNKLEVIIADGGSKDRTRQIAKKFRSIIIDNPLKTTEAGKVVGIKKAKGDLIASIDSDNILPNKNWLKQMVLPFKDRSIIGSEPILYTYRKKDPILTRYFALLGMNDPICLFIGNYDRMSVLTGKWTNLKFETIDKGSYLKVKLDHEPIPTIGANGTFLRRNILKKQIKGNRLFDIDTLVEIIRQKGSFNFAKVKNGIVHTFVEDDIKKFFRKQLRRINDMSYYKSINDRSVDWEGTFLWKILYFQLQCLVIFPIIFQTIKGYLRKPDKAWLFHPVACYSTWAIYLYGWIKGKISPKEYSRANWKQ